MAEVIRELLQTYGLEKGLATQRLKDAWEGIVGKTIATHTESLSVRDGKLFVKLDSSVVRSELGYVKSALVKKLNEAAGEDVITEMVLF